MRKCFCRFPCNGIHHYFIQSVIIISYSLVVADMIPTQVSVYNVIGACTVTYNVCREHEAQSYIM